MSPPCGKDDLAIMHSKSNAPVFLFPSGHQCRRLGDQVLPDRAGRLE